MSETETLDEAKQNIVDEFTFLGDWMQRYEHIIDIGRKLDDLPDEMQLDSHLVPGCQSRVWFYASRDDDGLIRFRADSDALIVRGLIALLLRLYSGRCADGMSRGSSGSTTLRTRASATWSNSSRSRPPTRRGSGS